MRFGKFGRGAIAVLVLGAGAALMGQTTAPTTQPTAKDLIGQLPKEPIALDFSDAPLEDVERYIQKAAKTRVIDPFQRDIRVTVKAEKLPVGYTVIADTTETDPPQLQFRVVALTIQMRVPIFMGTDPEKIPSEETVRTQVMSLNALDADKAREIVAAVLDKKAEVIANPVMKELIVTDTAAHIKNAATLLTALEKQAAENATRK
jgi:type II secretory pathway component GspD/PulD (secretin)